MSHSIKVLILLFFIFQILIATQFNLAHDEAYYWMFSKRLDWGYFDHPPLAALIIRIFSFLPHSEIGIRFGFVCLQIGTILVLLKTFDSKNLKVPLLLFLSFPLASGIGLFAVPDSPLLFMSAIYCLGLKNYLKNDSLKNALLLSLVIPLLLYSKYHGIFLVFWTLIAVPKILTRRSFYLIFFLSLVLFFPHIWWQYKNEFITFKYHFFERPEATLSYKRIAEYLLSQIFLAGFLVGPICWYLLFKKPSRDDFQRSLKFITFGSTLFFLISILSKKFEANWTIFLTIPIIILVTEDDVWSKKIVKTLLLMSLFFVLAFRLIFVPEFNFLKVNRLGEFHGWEKWSQQIKKQCADKIVANTYQIASKLSFYLDEDIHSLNYHSRKNQFDLWRLDLQSPTKKVCLITDKKNFGGDNLLSPEGKNLFLIKNLDYNELLKTKN